MMIDFGSASRTEYLAELLITAILLILMSAAFTTALSWPFATAFFPLVLSGFGTAVLALKLLRMIGPNILGKPGKTDMAKMAAGKTNVDDALTEAVSINPFATAMCRDWLQAITCLGFFFLLLCLAGIIPATFIFCLGYLKVVAKKSFVFASAYAFILTSLIYLLFVKILSLPLPGSLLI